MLLSYDMFIQVLVDLFRRRWRLSKEPSFGVRTLFFLAIYLTQHDKKVVTLLALDKPRGTDKCLDVYAGVTTFRAGECVFVFAAVATARGLVRGGAQAAGGRVLCW